MDGRSNCQILLKRRNVTRKLTLNQYKCHPLFNLVNTEINRQKLTGISIMPSLGVNHRTGNNFRHLLFEIVSRKRFLNEIKIDMVVLKQLWNVLSFRVFCIKCLFVDIFFQQIFHKNSHFLFLFFFCVQFLKIDVLAFNTFAKLLLYIKLLRLSK